MLAMVVTALVALAGGHTCGEWTLGECVERVLEEDPRIREARIEPGKFRRAAALALSDLLPAVNIGIGNDFGWGRSVDMQELLIINNRMNYAASLSASAAISSSDIFGAILSRREVLRAAEAAEESLLITIEGVITETVSAYMEALYSQLACDVCSSSCERIEAQADALRIRIGNGSGSLRDLEELHAQAADGRMALAEARGRYAKALLELKRLLNLLPDEELTLAPPPEADSFIRPEDLRHRLAGAGAEHGTKRAEALLERSRLRMRRARLASLPSITVSGGFGTYYGNTGPDGFREQIRGNVNPSLGIALTIPVSGGAARAMELNEARSELAGLEVEVERQRRDRAAAVGNDIAGAEGIFLCIEAAEAGAAAAEKAFITAQARFEAGEISGMELAMLCSNLTGAHLSLLQQRCRYLLHIKAMEYRYGILLCE